MKEVKNMLKCLDATSKYIDKFLQAVLATLAIVLLVVNLAQISGRYLFFYSIKWSEELSTYLYVWIIFLSLHMLTRENVELSIDVLKFKNRKSEATLALIRDVIVLVTVAILFCGSIMMIRNSLLFPRKTASLGITTSALYFCMPISFTLVFLQRFTGFLRHAGEVSGKLPPVK